MKIAIVGDPHISTGFRARVDDYLRTVLNKIKEIADDNDAVIFLGDVFDTSAMPTYVFNSTYQALKHYKGKLHTILGNHDMFHRNIKSLNKTTIGSLDYTEVIKIHTEPFELGGVTFVPVMTDDNGDKIRISEVTNKEVLLGHKYFEMFSCPEESLDRDQIARANYELVFLGHDHVPYEPTWINNTTLFRPGSLTRTTTDMYNKDRAIRYYQLDTKSMNVKEKRIFYLPSNQVFLKGSFDKPKDKVIRTDNSSLVKLLARMDRKNVTKLSLSETLKKLNGTAEEIQYLRELHLMHNISFN